MAHLALVAVGGNALLRAGQRGTLAEQRANAALTARHLVRLIQRGYRLVLAHGNGPQVGAQLLRSELAAGQVAPEPLDVCGADTQGAIGYLLEQALETALAEAGLATPVSTILTQTVVGPDDPAFQRPEKPIGPFYSADEAQRLAEERGWAMVEDASRGYRRVVPSPEPLAFVEIDAIRRLVDAGHVVIAAGGGGIPVVRRGRALVGVDAVIDKDRAAGLLASLLGARTLIISTDTDYVYLSYRRPGERPIRRAGLAELRHAEAAGEFPPGNMGPKIRAAIDFLERGGAEVIITSPELLLDAVLEGAGTHLYQEVLCTAAT